MIQGFAVDGTQKNVADLMNTGVTDVLTVAMVMNDRDGPVMGKGTTVTTLVRFAFRQFRHFFMN